MACKSCRSENQEKFRSEVAIHLSDSNKPLVFIFPTLLVCLECGRPEVSEEFMIPRDELFSLSRRDAARNQ